MPPKKKKPGRPKKAKTKVVSFRMTVSDYKEVKKHEGKTPELLAKEYIQSLLAKYLW